VSDDARTVGLYPARGGGAPRRISVGDSNVWAVAFSADGRRLATTSADHAVRVWDVAGGRMLWASPGAPVGFMRDVAFSPDGTKIAAVADNANVYVWDASTGRPVRVFENGLMAGFGLVFTRDSRYLAVGGASPEIALLDVATGALERAFGSETSVVAALRLSPRGDLFGARHRDGEDMTRPAPATLWDSASGDARLRIEMPGTRFIAMALTEAEAVLASWSDGALRMWAAPYPAR